MDLGLRDTVTLVTGGSDGLGAALVRTLVAEGGKVAMCARNQGRLSALAEELTAGGGDVLGVQADVTVPADLQRFVDRALDRFGRVDALVNNAGTSAAGRFESHTDQVWESDIELKVMAAVRASRLVIPALRAAGGGSIVNTLAISAKAPGAGTTPTAVSRAAGLALTKALSKELGPDNIRVNAVLIGLIESDQWVRRAASTGTPLADLYHQLGTGSGIPLGRVGTAQEFADLAAFLISSRGAYLSGVGINLDGGLSPAS
jgi:NAD(P)-dependent dehydrogenase (short-subunit alcohol dehydrogenase family)